MYEWQKQIQVIVDQIGQCIKNHDDEALTLHCLSGRLGYSEFHTTRKFKEISGMQFREYLRRRKLAFALKGFLRTNSCISKTTKAMVLGFLAEAESDPGAGPGNNLRPAGQYRG